jgi:hypothetical protein
MNERWTQSRTLGVAVPVAVPGVGERFQGAFDLFRAQPCAAPVVKTGEVMRYSSRADRTNGAWN